RRAHRRSGGRIRTCSCHGGRDMSAIAPDWALSAQAIDGTGSPHLQPGVHYRISTHPCLGLPLFPLAVYRLNLGPSGKAVSQSFMRTDVRWIDSHGAVLTPPFALTPDNPVRGYL